MADLNNLAPSANGSLLNNSPSNVDSNFSNSKSQESNATFNTSSNKMVNSSSLMAPRQEIFGREISKVQELMLQQEQSCEAELTELERQLAEIEAENSSMETRIAELESKESDQSEKKYEIVQKENEELTTYISSMALTNKELSLIIEEYQRSLSRFKSQYDAGEQDLVEQKKVLAEERDRALKHVSIMEAEFNNIHQRYEKCKHIVEHLRSNEQKFEALSHESSEKLRLLNILCLNLKEHATEMIERCHIEMEGVVKSNKTTNAKMQAILQRMDLKCESQDEIIHQINNEIKETTNMCDKLIGTLNKHCGSSWC